MIDSQSALPVKLPIMLSPHIDSSTYTANYQLHLIGCHWWCHPDDKMLSASRGSPA